MMALLIAIIAGLLAALILLARGDGGVEREVGRDWPRAPTARQPDRPGDVEG